MKDKIRKQKLMEFLDFIMEDSEDYQNDEVQKRLIQIEELYWQCFDHYE